METILAVVAPLPDMQCDVGDDEAALARHMQDNDAAAERLTANRALTPI
jgi:hypothetical protein